MKSWKLINTKLESVTLEFVVIILSNIASIRGLGLKNGGNLANLETLPLFQVLDVAGAIGTS